MRAILLASLALLIVTSSHYGQTPTNPNTPQAGNVMGGAGNGSLADNSFLNGFPIRMIDGNYVIVSFERNGVPVPGVLNRTVTIRGNIMTINTADPNNPAKTFIVQ